MESPVVLILLVEDEPLIGLTVQDALEEGGFGVLIAATGDEAMTALEDSGNAPAGLVTDIRLGKGLDGWEIARKAREMNPAIPIVYMSGDSAHEHSARGVPNSLMVQKPFAAAQIVTAISTLLNEVPAQKTD